MREPHGGPIPEAHTPASSGSGRWLRAARHPLLWVCAAHVLVAALVFDPKPFTGGDNFWYMLLGESLRTGQGYRDLWLPGTPLHTHYPPVYPLLLAALGWVTDSVVGWKMLSLAGTTGAVAFTFLLARMRLDDERLAAGAALLLAVTPAIVEYAHWVLSEATFVFFVTAALYASVRAPEGRDLRWFVVACVAAVAAYLTRSAGSPLLVALVAALAVRRRWSRAAWLGGLSAFTVLAWSWYVRWASTAAGATTTTYAQEFFYRDPYRPELGTVTVGDLVARAVFNVKAYLLSAWPQAVGGRDLAPALAGAIGLVLGGVVLAGALRRARRLEAPEWFFFLYVALLLVWPQAWSDQRLLLPLLPLAALYLVEAVAWALPHDRRAGRFRVIELAVGGVVVFALFANLRLLGPQLSCTRRALAGDTFACAPAPFVDFVQAADWIRANTEPDAVVINRKPQILYWYGRRRGDVYPYTADRDSILQTLEARRARYVVVDNLSATTWRYLVPAIRTVPSRFRVRHTVGSPPTYVLEYLGASPP